MRRALLVVATAMIAALVGGCQTGPPGPVPSPAPPSTTAPTPAATTSTTAPPTRPAVLDRVKVGPRTEDLTIDSPAVGEAVQVRVLLPAGFDAKPTRHWPVLYLLHGCCDDYLSWTRSTDVERLSSHLNALVVMPDGGRVGFYSDWREGPGWETFHTRELPAVLTTAYRADGPAAIAGLSMGGLGALGYAARHPGRYTAAASFSGIVDTRLTPEESAGYTGLVQSEGEDPYALWGDPDRDASTWREHNPYDLAGKLRGTRLFISCGDGRAGRLDLQGEAPNTTEAALIVENRAFARRLRQLHVPATVDLYGRGTHNWPYWQRELHRAWPLLTADLS